MRGRCFFQLIEVWLRINLVSSISVKLYLKIKYICQLDIVDIDNFKDDIYG